MNYGLKVFWNLGFFIIVFIVPINLLSCANGGSSASSNSTGGAHSLNTVPLSLSFVDGNGLYGINKDSQESANDPQSIVFNTKFYATWAENSSTTSTPQIRVAVYNGNDNSPVWTFVDGNGTTGINKYVSKNANRPQLTVFNSKLYAAWEEFGGSAEQIRVAVYNGNDTAPVWTFVDGNGLNGINYDFTKIADRPQLTVFNSKLYAAWEEYDSAVLQVRVAVYNGNDAAPSWAFVDGNGIFGAAPVLTLFNSKLYAIWQKLNGTETQIRVSVYNGNDGAPAWALVEGNGMTEIPKGTSSCATECIGFSGGGINLPEAITAASSGNIWIASQGNNGVTEISTGATSCSSNCINIAGGGISVPAAIAADSAGNVWVVNSGNNSITEITSGATASCASGCANFTGGGISVPAAIAADSAGNVWVANSGNNSVTEIPNGWTSCSTGCKSFTGGGIHSPLSITADPFGNVWVVNKEIGINKIKEKPANNPHLTVSGSKLYATWEESNDASTQIRMAVYNGNDVAPSWTFIDGNGVNGLNVDPLRSAHYPQLVVFASNLYVTWQEFNGVATQIRLAIYNGNDVAPSWTLMNGSGIGGLNYDVWDSADHPELTVFNSKLYVFWDEYNSVSHIRAAVTQ